MDDTIHYVVGGSVLTAMTSTNTQDATYVACTIQGSKGTKMICKLKNYNASPHQYGHQFERLLTGGTIGDNHSYSHMQLIKINGYMVLFVAETDAVDKSKKAMELKLGSHDPSGSKKEAFKKSTILQMISNGSNTLVHGERKGLKMISATKIYLHELINSITQRNKNKMVESITHAFTELSIKMPKDGVNEINFGRIVDCKLRPDLQILPPASVVMCYLLNVTPALLAQDAYRMELFGKRKKQNGVTTVHYWTNPFIYQEFYDGTLSKETNTEFCR